MLFRIKEASNPVQNIIDSLEILVEYFFIHQKNKTATKCITPITSENRIRAIKSVGQFVQTRDIAS